MAKKQKAKKPQEDAAPLPVLCGGCANQLLENLRGAVVVQETEFVGSMTSKVVLLGREIWVGRGEAEVVKKNARQFAVRFRRKLNKPILLGKKPRAGK